MSHNSFPIPQKSALKVVLVATMGHRAEWYIPLSEITGGEPPPVTDTPKTENTPEPQTLSKPAASTQDLENIVVDPSVPVFLKDVADIQLSVKDETSISRINGQDAVTVQLIRDTRVNLIELSHTTRDVIELLNHKLESQDASIVIQVDSAEFLESNLDLITDLALTGGLIAVIILWFFLRNIRLVLVIALALPISIFTSFNFACTRTSSLPVAAVLAPAA